MKALIHSDEMYPVLYVETPKTYEDWDIPVEIPNLLWLEYTVAYRQFMEVQKKLEPYFKESRGVKS